MVLVESLIKSPEDFTCYHPEHRARRDRPVAGLRSLHHAGSARALPVITVGVQAPNFLRRCLPDSFFAGLRCFLVRFQKGDLQPRNACHKEPASPAAQFVRLAPFRSNHLRVPAIVRGVGNI